jgi:probable F420-dependent oxidoreductase
LRLGISLPLIPLPARDNVALAGSARDLGYEDVWFAEVGGHDAYTLAAAVAVAQPGMRIGTAVVPAQTRTPMVHAMAAATLQQLTGGRFVLGLGISSENIVRDWAGQPFDRPTIRIREHLAVLRAALAGEKTDFSGATLQSHKFRLQVQAPPPPIYLGALNRRMLRLAGEIADGVVLNMVPETALSQVLGEVRAGAEAAGRDPATIEVVARLHVVLTDDASAGRKLVRSAFGAYVATSVYNRFFRWIGFGDVAAGVADGFAARDRAAVATAMSDEFCDAIAIVGGAGTLRQRVRAYAEEGVDVCVLNPITPPHLAVFEVAAGCLDGLDPSAGLGVARAGRHGGSSHGRNVPS